MKSLRGQLLKSLYIASTISIIVLATIVARNYGFFSENPPHLKAVISEMTDHVFIPVLLFFGVFYIGAFLIINRLGKILGELSKDTLIAADSLTSYQLPINTLPTEIRPFMEAINQLTEKLESHAQRQEAFAADAAHELKMPLSILALELDELSTGDSVRLGKQVKSLSRMIDQLLVLSISNSPNIKKKLSEIDPDIIGRRLVAELAPEAIESGRSLSFVSEYPEKFNGLEEAVCAALRTLIVNALRVTPPGGDVYLIVGPGPQFIIRDGGLGLDALKLERLKARGVRLDEVPGGTAGLGLAIANRIILAHGGNLVSCMPKQTALKLDFSASVLTS